MRKTLAAVALAGAALGFTAPAATADGCYGVQYRATVCYYGNFGVTSGSYNVCVYTGGPYCETYSVPLVGAELPYSYEVCVSRICTPI